LDEDDYLEGENHEETALRELYDYDGIIDDKRFLGWPPTPALNGWSMMDKYITPESGMTISKYDAHPNKEGQEKIAEAFIIRSISKMLMKKYLIVSGDSFVDRNFRSAAHPEMDVSWPMWPELLAEKLDMRLINLGKSGQGNEYIYSALQDTIEEFKDKNQIGMVVVGWSQCFRKDYQDGGGEMVYRKNRPI